jgi:peptide/nickel transport system ATP-binding protein
MSTALAADGVRLVRGYSADGKPLFAVEDVSLALLPGETLGIAGESGSGKTTLVHAFLGDVRRGLIAQGGFISIGGKRMTVGSEDGFEGLRGRVVALMPQSADSVLDPIMTVGAQLIETYRADFGSSGDRMMVELIAQLREFGFRDPEAVMRRYPHQLSGGQRQRIALCMTLIGKPSIVVLDEATTDLDVVTQQQVVKSIKRVQVERGFSLVAVSHDLRVLQDICDRLAVMYGGQIVETGPTQQIMLHPQHPYTKRLLERFHLKVHHSGGPSTPPSLRDGSARDDNVTLSGANGVSGVEGCAPIVRAEQQLLLQVHGLYASYKSGFLGRKHTEVLHDVNLDVNDGEILGIVGESGSGKTTLARILIGLHPADRGVVHFAGESIDKPAAARPLSLRRELQVIFQNPGTALNPALRVRDILGRRIQLFEDLSGSAATRRVRELLEWVDVRADALDCRPRMLSGGEQQRVAIARALIGSPRMLVCDEILSSLDVLLQARMLELLRKIQEARRLALVFISHDVSLVAALADRIAVFENGRIVEFDASERIVEHPQSPYTRQLVQAAYLSEEVSP